MTIHISRRRNIGISAHIDSGKTTLTERMLFYADRIHAIHDVKGKDGVGAKMDSMDLERERGITIQSAATHVEWKGHYVNIIDTPGHVDFTVEVERALRVLDGAVLVLCGVAGVQSQSLTVDRQMKRYSVPRIAFVNKCDRSGASPFRVTQQIREKLGLNAVLVQIPIGLEDQHRGVVDLVDMQALNFDGSNGELVARGPIPAELKEQAATYRERLLDAVSMFDDDLAEAVVEERAIPRSMVRRAIRNATISLELVPVFCGSAYKNRGVQPLLDAVIDYLPDPSQVTNQAIDTSYGSEGGPVPLTCAPEDPMVMLAFKLEDGRYGQLTYLRVYQGTLHRDATLFNQRTGRKLRVGRIVRMHADEMEDITVAGAGDIVAMFGIDCRTGDTFTDGSISCSMTSMHVPDPVISVSVHPVDTQAQANLSKALGRFTKEDPTFCVRVDPESGETIISGMGELHLEVYIERMKREYRAEVTVSPPKVAYREAISRRADFNYTHRKQTGGAGQFGKVVGWIEPDPEQGFVFESRVTGGNVPKEFIPSVEKGFRQMMDQGQLIGAPVVSVRVVLDDGNSHSVDSSDNAFQEAARGAWRETYRRAHPVILEPVMKVDVEGPVEYHGALIGTLMQRRGQVVGSHEAEGFARVEAEVPLAEMFGYATTLRSATQGKATFTMEFGRHVQVPASVAEELMDEHAKSRQRR